MSTFNPELILTTTIGRRAGGGEQITAKLGDFPQAAIDKFLTYGFQRVFNDAVGGADTPIADKVKAARDMVERFKRGEVGRVRGEAPDPFMVIVMRVVRQAVKAKNPDNYKRIMAGDKPDDVFKALFEKHRAADSPQYKAIMAKATLLRKQQEEAAKQTVDLGDDL